MRIDEIINDRNDPDRPLTDQEYYKLRQKFFFNLPIIENEDGKVSNPPDVEEAFQRFLIEAEKRGEIFNPTYDSQL